MAARDDAAMAWLSQPWQRLTTSTTGGDRVLLWKGSFGGDTISSSSGDASADGGGSSADRARMMAAAGSAEADAPAYAVLLTDLTGVWAERVTSAEIMQRQKTLNPSMQADGGANVVHTIKTLLTGQDPENKCQIERTADGWQLLLSRKIGYFNFRWTVDLRPVPSEVAHRILADQLLLPSLALATYYHQREQRAVELLQRKEKELNEVKALLHGMNVRHKSRTPAFDATTYVETPSVIGRTLGQWVAQPRLMADLIDGPLATTYEALQDAAHPGMRAVASLSPSRAGNAAGNAAGSAGPAPLPVVSAAGLGAGAASAMMLPTQSLAPMAELAPPKVALTAEEEILQRKRKLEEEQRLERERQAAKKKKKLVL